MQFVIKVMAKVKVTGGQSWHRVRIRIMVSVRVTTWSG